MKTYEVKIKVTKTFRVSVKANSEEEAFEIVQKNEKCFTDTTYKASGTIINYASAKPIKYQIECGKTLEEYMKKFGEAYNNGELWDFSAEDVNGGAIDLNPEQVYWEIDGRIYETKVL